MEDNNGNGNGHDTSEGLAIKKEFLGATVDLSTIQRQDGLIAQALDKQNKTGMGVIQTYIHAENDDKNYRQIFKNAIWKNTEEQDKAVLAKAECELTGCKKGLTIILDRLTARSAGIDGELMKDSFRALTHTSYEWNTNDKNKGKGNNQNNGNNYYKSNSPIS